MDTRGLPSTWRQHREGVMHFYAQRLEMPQIASQDDQPMALGCRRDHHVSEARRVALPSREVRQRAGDSRCLQIEGQYTGRIEMQQRIQPGRQIAGFAGRALALRLGDAVLDFRDCHDGQE